MNVNHNILFLSLLVLFIGILSSCETTSEEQLLADANFVCDTTNVTFSNAIRPLVDTHCLSCHNNRSQSGGVNLEGYANVKVYIDNGEFLGTIRHDAGFDPMPQGSSKLPDCDISKIEIWINNGALDN